METEIRVLLDNVRSAHNVGSIFRTADGAGVTHVYLAGVTPAPTDRFGRVQPEISKTSLGASESVPWEQVSAESVAAYITALKQEGFQIIAVEQDPRSTSLATFQHGERVLYIFGNEVGGVSPELLQLADEIVEIPMQGIKESLNVSVTAGIVLFH